MADQRISKRKIVQLAIMGGAAVFVLLLLVTPIGFILGEMFLIPLLCGVYPDVRWLIVFVPIVVAAVVLVWWTWGPSKNRT